LVGSFCGSLLKMMKLLLASIWALAAANNVPQPSQQCIAASQAKVTAMSQDQQFLDELKAFEDLYDGCQPKIEKCVQDALASGGNPSSDCITTTLTCLQTALAMFNKVNVDICMGTFGSVNLEELQLCSAKGKPKVPLDAQNPTQLTEIPLEIEIKACGPVECKVEELVGGALDFVPAEILAIASDFTFGCEDMKITTTAPPTTTTSKCDAEMNQLMLDMEKHPEAKADLTGIEAKTEQCKTAGEQCVAAAAQKGDQAEMEAAMLACMIDGLECAAEAMTDVMTKVCKGTYADLITSSEWELCGGEIEHDHGKHDVNIAICQPKACGPIKIPGMDIQWTCVDADLVLGAPTQSKLTLAAFGVLALLGYFGL